MSYFYSIFFSVACCEQLIGHTGLLAGTKPPQTRTNMHTREQSA